MTHLPAPRRLLVTGFSDFPGVQDNPSAWLAQHAATLPAPQGWAVRTLVLPTSYRDLESHLDRALAEWRPHWLLATGVAPRARQVQVESQARNYDDCHLRDATGDLRQGQIIVPTAPEYLPASISPQILIEQFRRQRFAAQLSESAGTYCCNHLFYHALWHGRQQSLAVNFIHLPPRLSQDRPYGYTDAQFRALAQALLAIAASLPAALLPALPMSTGA
jgi:pyroglutamyl-peptidase